MKVKGVYPRKNTTRTPPQHDFLKYWRVIRMWAKSKYGLGTPDLDMLLFLYSEQIFNKQQFKEYEELMFWDITRFKRLLTQQWIHVWRKRQGKEATLYELTYKSKRMINNIYNKLNGEEISERAFSNPMFRADASYMDKVNRNMIVKINKELKKPTS